MIVSMHHTALQHKFQSLGSLTQVNSRVNPNIKPTPERERLIQNSDNLSRGDVQVTLFPSVPHFLELSFS